MASDTREGDVAAIEATEKDSPPSAGVGMESVAASCSHEAVDLQQSNCVEGSDVLSESRACVEDKPGAGSVANSAAKKSRSVMQVQNRSRFPLARRLRKIVSTKARVHVKSGKSSFADKALVQEESVDLCRAEPAPEPECADPGPDEVVDRQQSEPGGTNQLEDLGDDLEGLETSIVVLEDPYSVLCDPYMNDLTQPEAAGLTVYSTDAAESADINALAADAPGSDAKLVGEADELEVSSSMPKQQPPPLKRRRGKAANVAKAKGASPHKELRRDAAEWRREVAADIAKENLPEALDDIHSERDGHAGALRGALLEFEERALRALGRVRDLRLQTEGAASLSPRRNESSTKADGDALSDDFADRLGEEPPASDNLYIKGLPPNITDAKLQKVFSAYGTVVQTRILDPDGYAGDSIALVRMGNTTEAQWVVDNLDAMIPKGLQEPVSVQFAAPRRQRVPQSKKSVGSLGVQEGSHSSAERRGRSRSLPRRKPFAMIRRRFLPTARQTRLRDVRDERDQETRRFRDVRDEREAVLLDAPSRSYSSRDEPLGESARPLLRRRPRITGAEIVERSRLRNDEGSLFSSDARRNHSEAEVAPPLPRRRRRDVADLDASSGQERLREEPREIRLASSRVHLREIEDDRPRMERDRDGRSPLSRRSSGESLRLVAGDRSIQVSSSRAFAREEGLRQRSREGSRVQLRSNEYFGRMKSFSAQTGYGFIESEKIKEKYGGDVFVHHSQIDQKEILINDEVIFEVVFNDLHKPQARNIRLRSTAQVASSSSRATAVCSSLRPPPPPRAEDQSAGRVARGYRTRPTDEDDVELRSRERLARRSSEEYLEPCIRRHRSHASEAASRHGEDSLEQRGHKTRGYAREAPLSGEDSLEPRRRRQRSFSAEIDEPISRRRQPSPLPARSQERHRGRHLQAAVESAAAAASKSGHVDADTRNRVEALASRLNDVSSTHERSARRRTTRDM